MALVGLEVPKLRFQVVHPGGLAIAARLIQCLPELGEMGVDGLHEQGFSGPSQLRAFAMASIPPFGGNSTDSGAACQSGESPWLRVNRQRRPHALVPLLGVLLLVGCGPDPRLQAERARQAEQQRLLTLCQRLSSRLPPLLTRFEAAEQQLAAVRASTYVPTAGPKPLDPEEQRRLTIDDQQTEQELHDQAVDAWSRAEAERRERWEREQRSRERVALEALDAAAAPLRQLRPELLLPGSPPRLQAAEVERFRDCNAERFR